MRRWFVVAVAVAVSVSALAVAAGAQSTNEAPKATDVGITPTEIHIAVVADVDNSIVPNLFKPSADAVKGFGDYINNSCKQKNKCLAGRKVVVDFYDSKLNPNETTNAEIEACTNDVAMVGTSAVFLTSVDNMRNCKDSTGAVTGLPDIPFVSTALVQQCSDQSFPMAPPQVICSTKDAHPQTFQPNIARAYYYDKKFGKDLHGVYVFGSDSKSARDSSFVSGIGQLRIQCCKSDKDFDIPGSTPQSGFTPIVQQMKSSGSNYAQAHDLPAERPAPQRGGPARADRREGVGLHGRLLRQALPLDGGRGRREPVRGSALPSLLQQGRTEGEQVDRQLREVHGHRQGRQLRCLRLGRRHRVPRRRERGGEGQRRRQRCDAEDTLRGVEQHALVQRRRHVRDHRPRRTEDAARVTSSCR